MSPSPLPYVPPALESPEQYQRTSTAVLETYDRAAQAIEEDLGVVLHDLRREGQERIIVGYAVDFAVIVDALEWFSRESPSSVWARLSLEFTVQGLILLPGAFYELKHHYASGRLAQHLELSNVGTALVRAFGRSDDFNSDETLRQYSAVRVEPPARYLARVLQSRLEALPRDLLPVRLDHEVLADAAYELARGTRRGRVDNNRADAVDLTIAEQVNRRASQTGFEIRIVTSAASSHRTARALARHRFDETHPLGRLNTRSPRAVMLHGLLRQASAWDIHAAIANAARARNRIVTYRQEILVALSQKRPPDETAEWSDPSDELLRAIGEIEGVQQALTRSMVGEPAPENTGPLLTEDGALNLIGEQITRIGSAYGASMALREVSEAGKAVSLGEETPVGTSLVRELRLGVSDVVSLFRTTDRVGVVAEPAPPLEAFLEYLRSMLRSFTAAAIAGRAAGADSSARVTVEFWDSEVDGWLSDSVLSPEVELTTSGIAEFCMVEPGDLALVRVDTEWFSCSWETGCCVYVTSQLDLLGLTDFLVAMVPAATGSRRAIERKLVEVYGAS